MTRHEQIRALAWSLHDLDLFPETATGKMLRRSLVAKSLEGTEQVPCPACSKPNEKLKGSGWKLDRFSRRFPCERCGGHTDTDGKQHKGTGKVAFDPYDNRRELRRVGTDDKPVAPSRTTTKVCPDCNGEGRYPNGHTCRTCKRTGEIEVSRFTLRIVSRDDGEGPDDPWDAAITRRDEAGSYHELELCLAVMRRTSPHQHRVFWAVCVTGEWAEADLEALERDRLEAALKWLSMSMPVPIVVPHDVLKAWRDRHERGTPRGAGVNGHVLTRRDRELLAEYERGQPTREIARRSGLSVRRVQEALDRARRSA